MHVKKLLTAGTTLMVGAAALVAHAMETPPKPSGLPCLEGNPPGATAPYAGQCPCGMVRIPGGRFRTGASVGGSSTVAPEVTVSTFCMDVTEVTVDAFGRCRTCRPPDTAKDCTWGQAHLTSHPVNCVDQDQAARYCESLGKRLPSHEEWEYAARGGAQHLRYPWGQEGPSQRACWNRTDGTCAAGSYPPGAFGLKDMAGNVWEWTAGSALGSTAGPLANAWGGAWTDDKPSRLQGTSRVTTTPRASLPFIGFRCAMRMP